MHVYDRIGISLIIPDGKNIIKRMMSNTQV